MNQHEINSKAIAATANNKQSAIGRPKIHNRESRTKINEFRM